MQVYKIDSTNNQSYGRILFSLLLMLPFTVSAQVETPSWVTAFPERTVDGIRYFEYTRYIYPWREYPSLRSLREMGFKVNLREKDVYITPDGKKVPRFENALWVVAPNSPNDEHNPPPADSPSSYTGQVYLPDIVEGKSDGTDLDVLGVDYSAMAEDLISIRTPLYMPINQNSFANAVDMQKVQIGACYSVEPYSFLNCTKLNTVIFEQAPYIYRYSYLPGYNQEDRSPFDEEVYEQAILYVREDQIEAFRQDKTWGKFKNIRDIEEYMAGVENITPDTVVEYQVFDLSGTQVRTVRSGESWREGLPAGLYIVKSSRGIVRKEIIRQTR